MKKMILLMAVATLALACQKNESDQEIPEIPKTSYIPLTIGSYWVYQEYNVDSNGVETEQNRKDSITVIGDTLINGLNYGMLNEYKINLTGIINFDTVYVRDSSGYMVYKDGTIFFSSINFTDTLNQGIQYQGNVDSSEVLYSYSYMMEMPDDPITIPIGTFEVLNYKGTIISNDNLPFPNPRYIDTYYADGVGRVMLSTFYFTSNLGVKKRLIEYFIAPE